MPAPNSAQTESACAGALGVQLAGPAYYFGEYYPQATIGDALRPIEPEDIRRANKMMYAESLLALLLGLAIRGVNFMTQLTHGGDWAGYRAQYGQDALEFFRPT